MVTIVDPRIKESSGLVCDPIDDEIIYTFDDEHRTPQVYAVSRITGKTLGSAALTPGAKEPEAICVLINNHLMLGDFGNNDLDRNDLALLEFPAFGRGDTSLSTNRYPIAYPGKYRDAETLICNPVTGQVRIFTKAKRTEFFKVPDQLHTGHVNTLEFRGFTDKIPYVTDACWTRNGKNVLCRRKGKKDRIYVLNDNFALIDDFKVPKVKKPESIDVTNDGRSVVFGSEGKNSPLITHPLPAYLTA